jgi:deoxycytidylate deaminase
MFGSWHSTHVPCAPCAALAIDEGYDQVHDGSSDEHFDQIVIKLLEH